MPNELKPCPFCGATHGVWVMEEMKPHFERFMFCVRCCHCGAQTMYFLDAEPAINSWNKRKKPWKMKRRANDEQR